MRREFIADIAEIAIGILEPWNPGTLEINSKVLQFLTYYLLPTIN
jgi:hypothetical protein